MGMLWWVKLDILASKLLLRKKTNFFRARKIGSPTSRGYCVFQSGYQKVFQFHSAKKDRSKWRRRDSLQTTSKFKSSEKSDYEVKRKCSFLVWWTKEFPWLEHDKVNNTMFCRVCCQFPTVSDSTSAFVTGTNNFIKKPIKNHDKTLHHKKCIGAQSVASFPEWTLSAKNILKVNQAHRKSSSVRTNCIFVLMIVIWLFYTVGYMIVDICVLKMFRLLSNFLHKKKSCFIQAS